MISYTIQSVLSIVSIVALVSFVFLRREMYASFNSLARFYAVTQSWFSIAVFVSAEVRDFQRPLLSERAILRFLSMLQLHSIFVSICFGLFYYTYKCGMLVPLKDRVAWIQVTSPRMLRLLFSWIVIAAVFFWVVSNSTDDLMKVYTEVAHDKLATNVHMPGQVCVSYTAYYGTILIETNNTFLVIYSTAAAATVIILVFLLYMRYRNIYRWLCLSVLPFSLALGLSQPMFLVDLNQKREWTREIAMDNFDDDNWGFGQVLSVFTWAPTLLGGVLWIRKAIIHRHGRNPHTYGSVLF